MHRGTLALLPLLCACGGPATPDDVSVSDSAGVRIVSALGPDHPWPVGLGEISRFGGAESGPASFTDATPRTVRTNGVDRIFVLDSKRAVVEVFDSGGNPVTTVGRRGPGPGEFLNPSYLVDVGRDAIGVLDDGKRAIVRWPSGGGSPDEWAVPGAFNYFSGLARHGDTLLISARKYDSLGLVHKLVLATPADTIVLDSVVGARARMVRFECTPAMLAPIFSPEMPWRTQGGRLIVAQQTRYRVDVHGDDRPIVSIRRPLESRPAAEADVRREYPDGFRILFRDGTECIIDPAELAEKAGMAERLPLIADVGFGPDSTIWVERFTFPGEPKVSDVFDGDGTYLGTVTGHGLPLGWLGRDRVLFSIDDDSTGVSVVGLYRMTRGSGAGTRQ